MFALIAFPPDHPVKHAELSKPGVCSSRGWLRKIHPARSVCAWPVHSGKSWTYSTSSRMLPADWVQIATAPIYLFNVGETSIRVGLIKEGIETRARNF
jgi:hypothetical protein